MLMELVNHPKFLGRGTSIPIPWPEKRSSVATRSGGSLPIVGNFYFEPSTSYPEYTIGTSPLNRDCRVTSHSGRRGSDPTMRDRTS